MDKPDRDNLYEQGYWFDKSDKQVHVSTMSDAYLLNIYKYLQKTMALQYQIDVHNMLNCAQPSGEMAQDCFDMELDNLMSEDPAEYIEHHPFYSSLEKELRKRKYYWSFSTATWEKVPQILSNAPTLSQVTQDNKPLSRDRKGA